MLFGNNKLKNATVNGAENIIKFPEATFKNQDAEVIIPTYTTDEPEKRIHLHIVPSKMSRFNTILSIYKLDINSKYCG